MRATLTYTLDSEYAAGSNFDLFCAGEGCLSASEAVPGSPVYVRLLLQVLLPEEEIAAAASLSSPTSARYIQTKHDK